jgi:hypothetical protein
VVALLVAYEYESFRDVVREFREAFYSFRAHGIETGGVDREVTLEVGDVEREWVCAVALRVGICCEMRRGFSRLVLVKWEKMIFKLNSGLLGRNNFESPPRECWSVYHCTRRHLVGGQNALSLSQRRPARQLDR